MFTIKILRYICKKFDLHCLINKDFDNSIVIEYFFKHPYKYLCIDLLPIFPLSNFILFNKSRGQNEYYKKWIDIDLPWINVFYYELYNDYR